MISQPIRVLLVDDSPSERELLLRVLRSDPQIGQVTVATNGEEAVEAACRERPDVVAMDVHMPNLNGVAAMRAIMERCPVPIVIFSSSDSYHPQGTKAFSALEAGAVALARKPSGVGHPRHAEDSAQFLQTVKTMAEVKVVKRKPFPPAKAPAPLAKAAEPAFPPKLVAIGASAGGPQALRCVLSGLPKNFPVPLLIVQHMTPGFAGGFAAWLQETTGFPVHVALQGEKMQSGQGYLAPDDMHLGVTSDGRIALSPDEPYNGVRPSVSHLFRSVKEAYGKHAVAVLLSGMGRDGAAELKELKDRGALTLVQDKESSVVYGMPGAAVSLGGASYVLPMERIARCLVSLTRAKESA